MGHVLRDELDGLELWGEVGFHHDNAVDCVGEDSVADDGVQWKRGG